MPQRPSNREIKALTHLGEENALGPGDFKDIGEKVFAGMLKKGLVVEAGVRAGASPTGRAAQTYTLAGGTK